MISWGQKRVERGGKVDAEVRRGMEVASSFRVKQAREIHLIHSDDCPETDTKAVLYLRVNEGPGGDQGLS